MKAKLITYSRLISKGNFENCKIEIQLEVEEGETASFVLGKAKSFVESHIYKESYQNIENYKLALKVLSDKGNHTLNQIKDAEETVNRWESDNDLPF
jgi:hypothetical protein